MVRKVWIKLTKGQVESLIEIASLRVPLSPMAMQRKDSILEELMEALKSFNERFKR